MFRAPSTTPKLFLASLTLALLLASACSRQEPPAEQEPAGGEADCAGETTALCGGDCVNLLTSTENCGECGKRCFRGQGCREGSCRGQGVVTVTELKERLEEKDFLLINVRVPPVGIIPGTDATVSHNDLEELQSVIGDDPDRPVVLYCGTQTRVQTPLRTLKDSGYRSLTYVEGGVSAWRSAGLPVDG